MSLTINLPSMTVGADAYQDVPKYCEISGIKAVLIGGKRALQAGEARLKDAIKESSIEIVDTVWYGGDANESNIDMLVNHPSVKAADMIFAMGGGRVCDTCKTVAKQLKKPVYTFPTIASNCAPTTDKGVIYKDSGEMLGLDFYDCPPEHCFADTQIIAEAPSQYIWAGIGDALSKEVESDFSARGKDLTFADKLGVQIVKGCNKRLYEVGAEAMAAAKAKKPSPAIDQVTLEIFGTTSLTSNLCDNDYNSNMAHAFYYGATVLEAGHKHLHGELVAYGTLCLLTMDKQFEARDEMYEFMKSINLSITLAQLEITTDEDLQALTDKAMTVNDIKCSPYEITRDMFLQSIKDVEALSH